MSILLHIKQPVFEFGFTQYKRYYNEYEYNFFLILYADFKFSREL